MPAIDSTFEEIEHQHAVQFYDSDDGALVSNVIRYLADGYRNGGCLLVLATQPHRVAFIAGLEALGIAAQQAIDDGRFVVLDAEETLRGFMVHGYPDALLFDATCGAVTRACIERAQGRGVRGYGEMVDLLWRSGKTAAAVRLEQLWDELYAKVDGFSIFCSYQIDIFGREFQPGAVDGVLCTHSTVIPSGNDDRLHQSISTAMAHVLGVDRTAEILPEITGVMPRKWASLPRGETMALQLRKTLPEQAGDVLNLARKYYLEKAG
ncbi:MAG TPA: MEDS domain-containing protein [Candidatus Baltobacteraceae bacterium]|nr:MEDS domain-containing protein [Candidatus Baltobacteraceae bacterium]